MCPQLRGQLSVKVVTGSLANAGHAFWKKYRASKGKVARAFDIWYIVPDLDVDSAEKKSKGCEKAIHALPEFCLYLAAQEVFPHTAS